MKFRILIVAFLIIGYTVSAQSGINFKTTTYNFGKIKKDKPVTYVFSFTNTLAKPAIVENATAECGCTTPEYPKEPIMKGKTGNIKVTFNAAAVGPFKKNVTIKFAGVEAPAVLNISGEVLDTKKKVK